MEDSFLRCRRFYRFEGALGAGREGPNLKAALLGKTPRYAPDRAFDTLHVFLDLAVDFRRRSLSGTCRTTIRAFADGLRRLEFDAVDLRVSGAEVDGEAASSRQSGGKLILSLKKPLSASQEAEVAVRYRVERPRAGLHFVYPGPHSPANPVQVWSQSQPEDARYWFPCHDSPHEKATSEVRVAVPRGFLAVSNGVLSEVSRRGPFSVFHWRMSQPHSLYLISLAAGRFSEITQDWDGIPVTYYCEKGREEDARRGLGMTPKALAYFSRMTGVRYPYEKYAQVAVAEYPGGMEHTTCTTQTDAVLIDKRASLDNDMDLLVAHELAHQWFGDLVTCRDWSHAWLNEGFATYFEILFQGHEKGDDEADYELFHNAQVYFDEDSRRYRRPIVTNTFKHPWTLFDRHTYEKGAWVLHMLRRELGDGLWWKSVGHYLRKYRDRTVETSDLIEAIGEATGRNLKPFFDQWVFKSGYPQFRIQYAWDPKGRRARLWVLQTQEVGEEAPLFKMPVEFRCAGRGWARSFSERISEKEHRFSFRLPGEPSNVEFDPEHWILKKVAFHKPYRMWSHQLLNGERAQSRHEAAVAVARWGSEESVRLLERAIRREGFWGAGREMIRALGSVKSEAAFQALKGLLNLENPKMRRAVVEALSQYRRPQTAALIAPMARRDQSLLVEAEASRALGALRDQRCLGLLVRNLGKRTYRDAVSAGAVAGIAESRHPSALKILRRMSRPPNGFWARAAAIRSLCDYARLSSEVVGWICELAKDPDERVNLVAIGALGQIEDERALPALKAALTSPNSRIRVYAEEAIARIRAGAPDKNRK